MKKEVLIAIISGLILGLIITVGIYTANRSINQQRAKKQLLSQPTPSLIPASNSKTVNLTSHENFDLVDTDSISLGGVAWPGAIVALIAEKDSQIVLADNEGIFSFNLKLIKGFNELTIIASDETGFNDSQNLILTYSTNEITELDKLSRLKLIKSAFAQEETVSVTDKIKERLQGTAAEGIVSIKEQLTSKSNQPRKKAYMGEVLNLDEASLTIKYKDQNFNINLVPKTAIIKGSNTAINWEALKVGDFVLALGWFTPAESEFTAVRLSLIPVPEPPINRQLIQGKISEVDGQKVTFGGKTITLSAKTDLTITDVKNPSSNDLELGDTLFTIVSLDSNGDIDSVNSVYVIPGKNNPVSLTPTNITATESASATDSAEDAQ